MLAHAPRGLTEQFLLARGFSVETLSSLVLATLAIVVTISQYSRQVLLDFAAAAGGRYLALTSSGSGGVSPRPMVEAKFACLAEQNLPAWRNMPLCRVGRSTVGGRLLMWTGTANYIIYQLPIDGLLNSSAGTTMPVMRPLNEAGEVSCWARFSQC
jgi:hypothetical protein